MAFLSNHLCQDPLENYFGCQRQKGGTNENPTVREYYHNTEALRVVNSFCRGPVRVIAKLKVKVFLLVIVHQLLKDKREPNLGKGRMNDLLTGYIDYSMIMYY